uniref:Uncharacterized protein n=1 Tax=Amphilophus citrinellus TaxID=61819 RepID=A0A3Q0RRC7_AMPCI
AVSVMAVGIMSASLLLLCLLHLFQSAPGAHAVFLRPKRANMFLLEELLQGNLERECYEELCNFEEAREYFEDTKRTVGNQCRHSPCLNGGNCTGKVGGFTCSCSAPYYGPVCELKAPEERVQRIKSSTASQTNAAGLPTPP